MPADQPGPTDQRGPDFILSADAADHPILLKFKPAQRWRVMELVVMSRRFCRLGVLHLYDDEIANHWKMPLDQWETFRDNLLARQILFETCTTQGSRQYEFAFWLVPYWGDPDKRLTQSWESVAAPAESAVKDKQGNPRRIYADDAEKMRYDRERRKARAAGRQPLSLEEFRRARTDYDTPAEDVAGEQTPAANDAHHGQNNAQKPARVTDDMQKNERADRNGNAPNSPLSKEVVEVSNHNYKEQLLLISNLCLTRYGEKPKAEEIDRNASDIIHMMQLIGVADKTIYEEFLTSPKIGLRECVRQMIYLPYHNAEKPNGHFCTQCRVGAKPPASFHAETSRRREDMARQQQKQQQADDREAAQEAEDFRRFRLGMERDSLTRAERAQLDKDAQARAAAKNHAAKTALQNGTADRPAIFQLIDVERDILLQERINARSRALGVDYAPPPVPEPVADLPAEQPKEEPKGEPRHAQP